MKNNLPQLIKECCVCKMWLDSSDKWHYPTTKQRREMFKQEREYTHSYCPPCVEYVHDRTKKELARFGL